MRLYFLLACAAFFSVKAIGHTVNISESEVLESIETAAKQLLGKRLRDGIFLGVADHDGMSSKSVDSDSVRLDDDLLPKVYADNILNAHRPFVKEASDPPPPVAVGSRGRGAVHPRVLFLIRTGSHNSRERLATVRETWAKNIPFSDIHVVTAASNQLSHDSGVTAYDCADNHGYGLCCVEASGEADALDRRGNYDWLFVIDDDVYVHTRNLAAALMQLPADEMAVWGIPGCGKCPHESSGLCGGGGYAVSRASLDVLGKDGSATFKKDFLRLARDEADNWADVAFACVAQERGLHLKPLNGLYGWALKPEEWEPAVKARDLPPLTFHYMSPQQMRTLDSTFSSLSSSSSFVQSSLLAIHDSLTAGVKEHLVEATYDLQRATYVKQENLRREISAQGGSESGK